MKTMIVFAAFLVVSSAYMPPGIALRPEIIPPKPDGGTVTAASVAEPVGPVSSILLDSLLVQIMMNVNAPEGAVSVEKPVLSVVPEPVIVPIVPDPTPDIEPVVITEPVFPEQPVVEPVIIDVITFVDPADILREILN